MTLLLLRRCLGLILTLAAATLVVFAATEILPAHLESPAPAVGLRLDSIAMQRTSAGLDRSRAERYAVWLEGLASGDLATDAIVPPGRPEPTMGQRVRLTLTFALGAMVLAVAIAIPTGLLTARFHATTADIALSSAARAGAATPEFWLAMVLLGLLAATLGWPLPPYSGAGDTADGPAPQAPILAILALALPQAAVLTRRIRAAALAAMDTDYVRAARATGMNKPAAFWRLAAANALVPLAGRLGGQFSAVLAAAVLVETVLGQRGVGPVLLEAVARRDHFAVRDIALVLAAAAIVVQFVIGLSALALDPRLRRPRHAGF